MDSNCRAALMGGNGAVIMRGGGAVVMRGDDTVQICDDAVTVLWLCYGDVGRRAATMLRRCGATMLRRCGGAGLIKISVSFLNQFEN